MVWVYPRSANCPIFLVDSAPKIPTKVSRPIMTSDSWKDELSSMAIVENKILIVANAKAPMHERKIKRGSSLSNCPIERKILA